MPRPGESPTREELLAWLVGRVAKWWIPDDVVFVEKIPLTATGKISKVELRQQFKDYRFGAGSQDRSQELRTRDPVPSMLDRKETP